MDASIAAAVLTWAESHPALVDTLGSPLPVGLEELPAEGVEAVMVSTLAGDPYVRRYKSGGYIAAYPFQLVLRTIEPDTMARIDAIRALSDIGSSIDDRATWPVAPEGYEIVSMAVRTSPSPVRTDEAGVRDYQATYELTYRKRG